MEASRAGAPYTCGAALALFHKIAAHASGLNHDKNRDQTSREQIRTHFFN